MKFGIIGAGIIATDYDTAIAEIENAQITAVCDINLEAASALAQKHGAQVFTDYRDMAGSADVDAVIINLPHYLHCDSTMLFLEKGIDVLLEKPMAVSSEECEKMIVAAKKNGTTLCIGHVQRYFPGSKLLRNMIETEEFGKLCFISEIRNRDYFTNRPAWFLDKEKSGGGIVINLGAHGLDKVLYTTGQKIKEIYSAVQFYNSEYNVETSAQILAKLENGVGVSLSYCGTKCPERYETVYFFENATVTTGGGGFTSVKYADGTQKELIGSRYPLWKCIKEEVEEFIKCVEGKPCNIANGEYGKQIISAVEGIYK